MFVLLLAAPVWADPPAMMGGGNFPNGEVNDQTLGKLQALNALGAGMCRVNVYPSFYLIDNDWSRPNVAVLDEFMDAAHEHGITPMILFEYYTEYHPQFGFGSEEQWFALGQAFAQRYRPDGTWARERGVRDFGVSLYTAINEPEPGEFREGGKLGPAPYVAAIRGLADGVHGADASLMVVPGGFMAANAWDDWTLRGLGPALAPLLNDGTLDGIDLHTYFDVKWAPMQGTYANSAQDNFDRVKIACGITADIRLYSTEFNYKRRDVSEEQAACGLLTAMFDQLGAVGANGKTGAAVLAFPWNLFNDQAEDPQFGMSKGLDPYRPTPRGQVVKMVLELTRDMEFTARDPRRRGVYVLEGQGRKLWVWQNREKWTTLLGPRYVITGIPAEAEVLEVYGWNGLRRTVELQGRTTLRLNDLAEGETHLFLAR